MKFLGGIRGQWRKWGSRLGVNSPPPILPVRQAYDLWAAGYGKDSNPVLDLESKGLGQMLPDMQGLAVLDLGCGKGRVSRLALKGGAKMVVGLDFSMPMLRGASSKLFSATHYLVSGDALHLPFKPLSFDGVISTLMMGHLGNLRAVLAGIAAVVRPGGFLLISDFHPYATLRGWDRSFVDEKTGQEYAIEQHVHLFEHYLANLVKLGFELQKLQEPLYEGFPLVFLLRARKQPEKQAESFEESKDPSTARKAVRLGEG